MVLTSEAFVRDYNRLRQGAASFALDAWSPIELWGEDRIEWLQGQATNDLRGVQSGDSFAFLFCEPTGQILAPVNGWILEDRVFMTVPRELTETVLARIERMTIMEDVTALDATASSVGRSIQGPLADQEWLTFFPEGADGVVVLDSDRTGSGGKDVWLRRSEEEGEGEGGEVSDIDPLAYEAVRIEAGIPKWGVDFGPKTLPAEMGSAFVARHVSYEKGCYTGQEVLMRMYTRGHTNKTWCGLVSLSALEVGMMVTLNGNAVGSVTSAAPSPRFGWVGAAMLRNEATEEGTKVLVGEGEAEIRTMPILRPL